MQTIDIKDIQGIVLKGYGAMNNARYCLLKIETPDKAKLWLEEISLKISDGDHSPEIASLNIAFTHHGLKALGMNSDNLRNFCREFREGMTTPHKQRLLGDFDSSAPTEWRWGGLTKNGFGEEDIHILLMVYGKDGETLNQFHSELETRFLSLGLRIILNLDGHINKDGKEHFGFGDGIAQPVIGGSGQKGEANNIVAPGEFILGYKNQYGVYPETPLIQSPQGDLSLLSNDEQGSAFKNIGRNGSYLVFRQMEQHIDRFWNFMNDNSKKEDGTLNREESIKLASKMVGRWPSGAPLAVYPESDPGQITELDNFGYSQNDKNGLRCPFGSHIRRTNPRDAFEDNKAKLSSKLTNKHRIIRRGRSYGTAIDAGPDNYKVAHEVGLHFICINANIENQFEFIQRTWSNNPSFQNLYNEPDPITGTQENRDNSLTQNFTVQDFPTNRCVQNLPQFVTIRGGAYFFLPSISAIKYLASL